MKAVGRMALPSQRFQGLIAQLSDSEWPIVFGRVTLCQGEKVVARQIRYIMNATYAAVIAHTTAPTITPFTSEEKNSSKR